MTTSSNITSDTPAPDSSKARVWDLWVRITHWLLVLCVAGAWATRKLPGDWFQWHVRIGYTVFVLVVVRILWGFLGTRHARFTQFVRGPGAIVAYVRALLGGGNVSTVGHNPLGALMVLALLGLLLGQATTGLFASDTDVFEYGPLMGYVTQETSRFLTGWHEEIAEIMLWFIGLHVLAAMAYLHLKHENLITPMFTGRKEAAQVPPAERITSSRLWLALVLVVLVAAGLWYAVRRAPVVEAIFAF